jgi:hypothetical protein
MVENQDSVFSWARETFPGADPLSPRLALRCLEEMVELCLAAGASAHDIHIAFFGVVRATTLKRHPEIDEKTGNPVGYQVERFWYEQDANSPDVPAEAADVLITLYVLAGYRGFHLDSAVDDKMKTNRSRRWKANGDGTGYHIPEEAKDAGPVA